MVDPDTSAGTLRRQQMVYWQQYGRLKIIEVCVRHDRERPARQVRAVEPIKVAKSSGAIAGWVVWKDWPMLWSAMMAASQLLDATKHEFPFGRLHEAARGLSSAFELLCIDAEAEQETVQVRSTVCGSSLGALYPADVSERRKRLAKLGADTGIILTRRLRPRRPVKARARREVDQPLETTYREGLWSTPASGPR